MTQSLVYQYVWRDFSLPAYKGWVLTLTDPKARVFLAFVTTLVTYTQSRTWISVRYIINKTTRPIQLRDDDDPASQATAIRTFSDPQSYFTSRATLPGESADRLNYFRRFRVGSEPSLSPISLSSAPSVS
jgi:hypothetical protein